MSHKRRFSRQQGKLKYTPKGGKQPLVFYTVAFINGQPKATLVPAPPENSIDDNSSILSLDQWGISVHITWITGKPEPETEDRHNGIMAVMEDIHHIVYPDKVMEPHEYGIGHAYGATVEFIDEREG